MPKNPHASCSMFANLAQFTLAERQWWAEVVDHLAVEFVARTLFLGIIGIEIAHGVQLIIGHLDGRLEHNPNDALGAGWCR